MKKRVYLNIVEGDINEVSKNEYYATRDENGEINLVVRATDIDSSTELGATTSPLTALRFSSEIYRNQNLLDGTLGSKDREAGEEFFNTQLSIIKSKIDKGECVEGIDSNSNETIYLLYIKNDSFSYEVVANKDINKFMFKEYNMWNDSTKELNDVTTYIEKRSNDHWYATRMEYPKVTFK
jgi:hypothetical protein